MPKGFKRKNAGVGVDFKRVKHKVGKKVGKAQNETDTNVVSKSITLPEQSIAVDKGGAAVTHRNLSLKDLLSQCTHHNDRVRCDALKGLIELLKANPKEAQVSALQLLTTVSSRLADRDESCRAAVKQLLQEALLPAMGRTALSPFFPVLLAHVNAALTHLAFPIRTDAMACLEVLMDYRPASINPEEFTVVLEHFVSSLSRKSRGGGVSLKTGSLQSLLTIVTKLLGFLNKAFPKIKPSKPFGNQSSNNVLPLGARRCGLAPSAGLSNECTGSSIAAAINLFRVLCKECWAECIPDSLSIGPDEDSALCAAAVVQSCLVLVDRFGKVQNFLKDCESCFEDVAKYFPIQSPDSNTLKSRRTEQSLVDINVTMAHLLVRFMSPFHINARGVGSKGACNSEVWKDRLERLVSWLDGVFVHGSGLKKTRDACNNVANSLREPFPESISLPALTIASELLARLATMDYVKKSHTSRILQSILEFWKRTCTSYTPKSELHKTKIITAIMETFLVFDYGPELEYCIEVILNDLLKVLWISLQSGSNALTADLANKAFTLLLNVASRRPTSQGLLQVSETIGALFCYPGNATRKQQRKNELKKNPERRRRCHPGPVTALPMADRTLAVDVLYHLPGLSDGIIDTVKAIALEMTENEYSQGLAVRLVDMVTQKFAAAAANGWLEQSKQRHVCIDFIVDLCMGPDIRCCGQNLDCWKRHTAIVQAGLRGVRGLERLIANRLLEALDKTSDVHSQSQDMRGMYHTYSLLQLCKETGSLYTDDTRAEQQCILAWSSRVTTFMLDCVSTSCFVPPLDGDVHSTAQFVLSGLACDYSKTFQIMEVALGVDCLGCLSNWSTIEPALALVQAWVAAMNNYRKKEAAVVLNRLVRCLASAVLALPTVVRDEAKVVSLQNEYKKTIAVVSGALGGLYEAPP